MSTIEVNRRKMPQS